MFGFAGWSGSGKTTLIEQVIPRLSALGLVVSLVKHAHHSFDVDQPGKDSFRHRVAGCREVLVSSATRWALMHELRGAAEMTIEEALSHGFRRATLRWSRDSRRRPSPSSKSGAQPSASRFFTLRIRTSWR